ncbi:M20 family metallo-hydrolase [Rhodococcus ruber]|uniref:M20 family metallo-hydrolase n=1 Tax=Rhodococcus ruber TaxID=1830 RepID=UPI0007CD6416|nr:M20 family metallo-hydrolase [Rhodococcus ruber]AWH01479.1 Zn-dependent hydrolase [Rhodococcus ruber]QRE79102.1 M20 family metallo-hydrolase [Rhodococcus ruber]
MPEHDDFLDDFTAWSRFGATAGGGLHRLAASEEHATARRWLTDWLTARGFTVRIDAVGNLFGLLEWVPGAPYVLVGSHSDSQPSAGRFDGAYGVLAAAHAATGVDGAVAAGQFAPVVNVAVVDWFNEEGARFQPSLMGSGGYVGRYTVDQILERRDLDGVSVREALTNIGFHGSDEPPDAVAYAEVHIEQGRELEKTGTDIGVVTANWAVRKYTVVVHGEQAHTGATSMADRRDALVGAARVVLAVRAVASGHVPDAVLSSVGRFVIEPNSPVVVPSRVRIDVDIRSSDAGTLEKAHAEFVQALAAITDEGEVTVEIVACALRPSTPYPAAGVELTEAVVAEAGYTSRRMLTRAGHDSISLKDVVPTVMLFVPSSNGISHNESEFTEDADLLRGLDVLSAVVRNLTAGALLSDEAREVAAR